MRINPSQFFNRTVRVIEQMTEVTRDHLLTPELSLRLVTPRCSLWHGDHRACPFLDPYWAFYWPGGEALTRYLLDNRNIIKGKHVLDVGSGCGSVAIAAANLGLAASVTANDIDPIAAVAIELNATLNECKSNSIKILTNDLIGRFPLPLKCDCVFLGDMFYDDKFNDILMEWLLRLLSSDIKIFIGDPGRHEKFIEEYRHLVVKVAEYPISNNYIKINHLKSRCIFVWKLSCK